MKQKLSVFENTMNYLFKPRETRDLDNVNRMRKKYEKMGIKRLENLLIVYEARIKKSQQIFYRYNISDFHCFIRWFWNWCI